MVGLSSVFCGCDFWFGLELVKVVLGLGLFLLFGFPGG